MKKPEQRDYTRDCHTSADTQQLEGDQRRHFMTDCMRSKQK
ncbi:MAG: hypothetical protein HY080_04210 [Gammaproteobacteria bacterium]|nr:hypothetical protein [Gammaproteobacteria bacterium]